MFVSSRRRHRRRRQHSDRSSSSPDYKNVRCVAGPERSCSSHRVRPAPLRDSAERISVYTVIDRRMTNIDRLPETMERAERDYFPKLRSAPGFVGFHLIADEGGELFVAVNVWEDKASADAF